METCEICKEEGRRNTKFKNNLGLGIHLGKKHGISLEEYKSTYNQEEPVKKEVIEEVIQPEEQEEQEEQEEEEEHVDVNEPIVEPIVETKEAELAIEPEKEMTVLETVTPETNGLPKITNYSLLDSNNFVAMFRFENTGNETYKKIIGIGTIIEDEKSTISALVIGDDGLTIPVFMIPEFVGIVEIKSKIFTKAVKSEWANQKKTSKKQVKQVSSKPGLFTRKRKSVPKNVTNAELVEGFSKILASRKNKGL